jgi:S1-C subfamily serine protease
MLASPAHSPLEQQTPGRSSGARWRRENKQCGPQCLSFLLPALLFLRCASSGPPPLETRPIHAVEQHDPVRAEENGSDTIEFSKFILKLPADRIIGTIETGKPCVGHAPLTWKAGLDSQVAEGLGQVLLEELSAAGYSTLGEREPLFEDLHERKGEYVIAGIIREIQANVCYDNPKKHIGIAEASLAVAWQVFSRRTKTVELKLTTEGSTQTGNLPDSSPEAVTRAFVSAARNLLADSRFHDLVSESAVKSRKRNEPITIAYETRASRTSPSVESIVSDSRMGVVTVFAGDVMGSGFVISPDGYLLTDEHVVGSVRYVRVQFVTGRQVNGEVVRTDRRRDVALVKLESDIYPYLPLGESSRVQPGTDVFAIGTPLAQNLGQTVSKGVVSGYGEEDGLRVLRSDVPVHRGNSGGPLLDRSGIVVGMSVSGFMLLPDGVGVGLNAFIPIEEALSTLAIEPLKKHSGG